jgi:hypothetical protein
VAPVQPIIVRVVEAPATPELGFGGILLQALGLTGLTLVLSLVLGLVLGVLFIWLRARRPMNSFNGTGSQQVRLSLEPPLRPSHTTQG